MKEIRRCLDVKLSKGEMGYNGTTVPKRSPTSYRARHVLLLWISMGRKCTVGLGWIRSIGWGFADSPDIVLWAAFDRPKMGKSPFRYAWADDPCG